MKLNGKKFDNVSTISLLSLKLKTFKEISN